AGLEDVAAQVGFGAVAETLAAGALDVEAARARAQTDRLLSAALDIAGVTAFGDKTDRLPHVICLGVDGVEAEAVLLGLDQAGVAAHSGSACSSEALEPSPVLEAMGVDAERSLRLSVGWSTRDDEIEVAAAALPAVVDRLRALAAG
ncbi:MAG TPA: aminotransferase class V-fold PLP-dependent enzyme, partial [Acidimicrobiales bacterium]